VVEEEPTPETEDTEPTPTPTPVTDVEPTTTPAPPEPTGEVGGSTGTPAAPRATLPPTDTIDGAGEMMSGDGWRLVLLAMAGALGATLILTPARAVVRKDDNAR
jgi:hypothetical protein